MSQPQEVPSLSARATVPRVTRSHQARETERTPKPGTLPVHNPTLKEACGQEKSRPCLGKHQSRAPPGARSGSAPSLHQRTARLQASVQPGSSVHSARSVHTRVPCTQQLPLSADIQSGRPSSPTLNLNKVEGGAAFWRRASK